ncbi:hypothetical protein K505DRAFT_252972 [Melanomma pulvis-pyrius CBS 109.77]|uniref:HPP transmembrane region domain-containing protein n=1 Tax=Melanomma pulvis-pyrius CBS 109.77 TaxID=1314802 RepID=A0A6A6X118_9PLEO|nr:hypothetical protein K505DRAFT_252972 [Melanomma pulvis-pyrius CBS 109.77]
MTPASLVRRSETWNFDIDAYTNPYTPPSPLHRFPPWLSRFLGYRKEQKEDVGNVLGAVWSCVGTVLGLAVIAAVFNNTASIRAHNPPALIASFGASAVLEYNAIRSPLGQPRNALLGHTISAIVGVAITKLFQLSPHFESVKWVAGAVSCGTASALMLLTGTVHPPGGASAVLAATSPEIMAMGWYFVGLVVWGTTLMLGVGLGVNNVQRRFPLYWWTPVDLRELQRRRRRDGRADVENDVQPEKIVDVVREGEEKVSLGGIRIEAWGVEVPEDLVLSKEEAMLLEVLRERLRKRGDDGVLERVPSSRPSTDCTMVLSRSGRSGSDTEVLYSVT